MRKVEWMSKRCDPRTLVASQLMEDNVATCNPTDVVIMVAHQLNDGNFGSLPVVDQTQSLLGIVTEFDVLKVLEAGKDLNSVVVSDVMSTEVTTVEETTPFIEILQLLQAHHLLRVPVVKGKTLVGLVARRDIILGYIKATAVGGSG